MRTYERSMKRACRLMDEALDALSEATSNTDFDNRWIDYQVEHDGVTVREIEHFLRNMVGFLASQGVEVKLDSDLI